MENVLIIFILRVSITAITVTLLQSTYIVKRLIRPYGE